MRASPASVHPPVVSHASFRPFVQKTIAIRARGSRSVSLSRRVARSQVDYRAVRGDRESSLVLFDAYRHCPRRFRVTSAHSGFMCISIYAQRATAKRFDPARARGIQFRKTIPIFSHYHFLVIILVIMNLEGESKKNFVHLRKTSR